MLWNPTYKPLQQSVCPHTVRAAGISFIKPIDFSYSFEWVTVNSPYLSCQELQVNTRRLQSPAWGLMMGLSEEWVCWTQGFVRVTGESGWFSLRGQNIWRCPSSAVCMRKSLEKLPSVCIRTQAYYIILHYNFLLIKQIKKQQISSVCWRVDSYNEWPVSLQMTVI